jgi:hypothetical protein
MEVVFRKPAFEPVLGAIIYRAGSNYYRIFIGTEGCELPDPTGWEMVEEYGFYPRREIERWVGEKVRELESQGAAVKPDESLSYLMCVMIDGLAAESPIKI